MSASVLHFTPRDELEPLANIDAFIELCRASAVLDANKQFGENRWVTERLKGKNGENSVIFSTLEASALKVSEPCFPAQFLNFAKALTVYLQDKRPVVSQSVRIAALRCIEAALREQGKDSRPTAVNTDVLDGAVELARQQMSAAVAYRVAGQIEYIAELMAAKQFVSFSLPWTHGLKKPREVGSRISKEALAARQEKLPSPAALRAIAGIFISAVEPADVLVSSNLALLTCAPERINEVIRLRRNCIVNGDNEFKGVLGLRWSGSKGFENSTKWLPSEMADVARDAVSNLLKVTAPAQQLAKWYMDNPQKLFLHEGAKHLRGAELLTAAEVALILWNDESARDSANTWLSGREIKGTPLERKRLGYRFADVERAVIEMLPSSFPYMPGPPDLLCCDSVAVMRTNELHATRAVYMCMFTTVDYNTITNPLGARKERASIFERFGFTEDDGSPIEFQSHSLRHYLNTLAQAGGLSDTEIAIWSGRRDVGQNKFYDHMSSEEVQAPVSQALAAGFTSELEPIAAAQRSLYERSAFRKLGLTAAHTTEFGWCMHNFASEPCSMYRDCMNCEEQECVKGDSHKEANLRLLKGETEYLLKQAKAALGDEEYGADSWVKHQMMTLSRVNAMLEIFENPEVPVGARIRLDVHNAPLITNNNEKPIRFIRMDKTKALTA